MRPSKESGWLTYRWTVTRRRLPRAPLAAGRFAWAIPPRACSVSTPACGRWLRRRRLRAAGCSTTRRSRRYVLGGWWPTSGPTAKGGTVLALAEQNLAVLAEEPWLEDRPPDVFESYGDQLLALTRSGNAQLSTLAADSLRPVGRTILGVQLLDMALDEDTSTLYVADNHQRIHVVSAGDGRERAIWQGKAPLALDARNGRLYVNSSEGVQALDKQTGQVRASYPQAGAIAADPARDLVYLVDGGVTMYDRLGRPAGRLTSTFPIPQGFSPNPYAVAAWVNPVTGDLAVAMNNGTPGSNNSTYLRLYPPGVDRPITITSTVQWVQGVTFDPAGGDAFVSYGASFKGLEALQRLGRSGAELAALRGRYGALALDRRAGLLYAAASGAIARVRAADLSLLAVYRAPEQVQQLLLDSAAGRLYARDPASSRLAVIPLAALEAPDMRPQPVSGLPGDAVRELAATADGPGTALYVSAGMDLYRFARHESVGAPARGLRAALRSAHRGRRRHRRRALRRRRALLHGER